MKKMIAGLMRRLCMVGAGYAEMPNAFGDGTHANGRLTKFCDAALATSNLLLKKGTDASHVAVTAAATDYPMGFNYAPTDAAEDTVGLHLLGKGGDTKLGVASGAIAADDRLVPAAAGKVQTIPTASGTYWVIGRAVTAAADGEPVEVDDCHPFQVTISG